MDRSSICSSCLPDLCGLKYWSGLQFYTSSVAYHSSALMRDRDQVWYNTQKIGGDVLLISVVWRENIQHQNSDALLHFMPFDQFRSPDLKPL